MSSLVITYGPGGHNHERNQTNYGNTRSDRPPAEDFFLHEHYSPEKNQAKYEQAIWPGEGEQTEYYAACDRPPVFSGLL